MRRGAVGRKGEAVSRTTKIDWTKGVRGPRTWRMPSSCRRGRRKCFCCRHFKGDTDDCRRRDDTEGLRSAVDEVLQQPPADEIRRRVDEYGCPRMFYTFDDGFRWDDEDQAWWDAHIYDWCNGETQLVAPLIERLRIR